MTRTKTTFGLQELREPLRDVIRLQNRGIRLVIEDLASKQSMQVHALLQDILGTVPDMNQHEYRYLMGNLNAMDIMSTMDTEKQEQLCGVIGMLREHAEGERQQRWDRMRTLLSRGKRKSNREEGSVAMMNNSRSVQPRHVATRLGILQDLVATAYPFGIDLLEPGRAEEGVATLDARKPVRMTFGTGGARNEVEFHPDRRLGATTITYVADEDEWVDTRQADFYENNAVTVGREQRMDGVFGARFHETLILPVNILTGDNRDHSNVLVARHRQRLAFLLKCGRGKVTLEQGDDIWTYDPMVSAGDTFGATERKKRETAAD